MEAEQLLENLGLSKNEAKTYLTLLKLGSVPAGPLIKGLGMHRAAVYDLLDILIDKGLVHYVVQANRKYFEAQSPERLIEIIEQEKQKLNKKEALLKEQIPKLESLRQIAKESQEGTIYKGKKGLKSIFEDVLKYSNQEYIVMGASGKFKEIFNAYFIHWQTRRVTANINLRIVYSESIRKEKREKELKLSEIRYTKNTNITPSTTFIYGDKVAIIMWSDIPLAFLMRSQNVSDSYRNCFDILWNSSTK
jgi:sugar-specific transcriptional regulator TrmB